MNHTCTRRHSITFVTLLSGALLASCATVSDQATPDVEGPVLDQLARAKDTLALKGLPLQIIGYTSADSLDTEDAVRLVKADILDPNALVPQYDGMNAASLRLQSIHDRMQAFQEGANSQNVIENITSIMFPNIRVGQKVLDVRWEEQGREFTTKLVYDQNGMVYDNLLSNLAVVEVSEVVPESPPSNAARAKAEGALALANQQWSTRFQNITITWVTGGTRGKIELDHYVISCDNWVSFCDDGGVANAWMQAGSADAQTARNALVYPRISKLAWGYGWATPTASFSISFNYKNLTFSVSVSGIGSTGKGSGIHTIF